MAWTAPVTSYQPHPLYGQQACPEPWLIAEDYDHTCPGCGAWTDLPVCPACRRDVLEAEALADELRGLA